MSLEDQILNIFNLEKKHVKADALYFTNFQQQQQNLKRLHRRSWKFVFKNAKFLFFDFCQNIHLEVVLPTSKYKK
jgi:hypothetical protein